jgi:ketosteroid isomerase-like protein
MVIGELMRRAATPGSQYLSESRKGATAMTADDVIRTHTQRFNGALLSRDLEALSTIYSDDYMLVRPDGSSLSKHEVLHDLRDGGLMFKSVELDDVKVRVYGPTALLTATAWTVTSRAGKDTRSHARLLAVYVADGDDLRLAHFQSVRLD